VFADLTDHSAASCSVAIHCFNSGRAMQALGATVVASVILYFVDRDMNDGRYSEIVVDVLRHLGSLVGVHV
jgi:hypothetical protein